MATSSTPRVHFGIELHREIVRRLRDDPGVVEAAVRHGLIDGAVLAPEVRSAVRRRLQRLFAD